MTVLFLPGDDAPEVWVWKVLRLRTKLMAAQLHVDADELADRMNRLDAAYDLASEGPAEIAKVKLRNLADPLGWDVPDLCQTVACAEAGRTNGERHALMKELERALDKWCQEYV